MTKTTNDDPLSSGPSTSNINLLASTMLETPLKETFQQSGPQKCIHSVTVTPGASVADRGDDEDDFEIGIMDENDSFRFNVDVKKPMGICEGLERSSIEFIQLKRRRPVFLTPEKKRTGKKRVFEPTSPEYQSDSDIIPPPRPSRNRCSSELAPPKDIKWFLSDPARNDYILLPPRIIRHDAKVPWQTKRRKLTDPVSSMLKDLKVQDSLDIHIS